MKEGVKTGVRESGIESKKVRDEPGSCELPNEKPHCPVLHAAVLVLLCFSPGFEGHGGALLLPSSLPPCPRYRPIISQFSPLIR